MTLITRKIKLQEEKKEIDRSSDVETVCSENSSAYVLRLFLCIVAVVTCHRLSAQYSIC
jgi:hypothetical protein